MQWEEKTTSVLDQPDDLKTKLESHFPGITSRLEQCKSDGSILLVHHIVFSPEEPELPGLLVSYAERFEVPVMFATNRD